MFSIFHTYSAESSKNTREENYRAFRLAFSHCFDAWLNDLTGSDNGPKKNLGLLIEKVYKCLKNRHKSLNLSSESIAEIIQAITKVKILISDPDNFIKEFTEGFCNYRDQFFGKKSTPHTDRTLPVFKHRDREMWGSMFSNILSNRQIKSKRNPKMNIKSFLNPHP